MGTMKPFFKALYFTAVNAFPWPSGKQTVRNRYRKSGRSRSYEVRGYLK